jgi:hypothetical protein
LLPRRGEPKVLERALQHVINLVERVEHLERVLKNCLYFREEGSMIASGKIGQVLAPEQHLARGWGRQPEQHPDQCGLAAPALTHDRGHGRRVAANLKREVPQGDRFLLAQQARAKDFGDIPRLEQRRHHASSYRWQATS